METNYKNILKYEVFNCKMGCSRNSAKHSIMISENSFSLSKGLCEELSVNNVVYFADNKEIGYILISTTPLTDDYIEATVNNEGLSTVDDETMQAIITLFDVKDEITLFDRIAIPSGDHNYFAGILV